MAMKPTTMADFAVKYAEHGFKPYPLIPGGKVPHKGSNGHLDGSDNPEKVKEMFIQNGINSNIGISLIDVDIIILDIDLHDEAASGFDSIRELEDAYEPLPETFTVSTPRNGLHKYYRLPGMSMNKDFIGFRPGLDILSTKIYAPPSMVKDAGGEVIGSYKVKSGKITELANLPNFFIELMVQHDKQKQQSDEGFTVNYSTRYGDGKGKTIQLLEEIVQGVEIGGRNSFFARAIGTLLKANMSIEAAIALMIDWNKYYVKPPLSSAELHAVIKSVVSRENKKERSD
jgi:hypothetical protein